MPDGLLLLSLLVLLTPGTSESTRSASPDGGPPPPLSPPSLSPPLPPAPGAATAVVTLVNEPGEEAGAIALGASLAMAGSVARRVVLVRGGLGAAIRPVLLRAFWDEVEETEGVRCSAAAAAHAGDGGGAHDHDHGCTVLALFSLTRYERLLYMDASTLALPRLDFDALLWSGLGLGLGLGSGSGSGLGLGLGLANPNPHQVSRERGDGRADRRDCRSGSHRHRPTAPRHHALPQCAARSAHPPWRWWRWERGRRRSGRSAAALVHARRIRAGTLILTLTLTLTLTPTLT